MAKITKITIGSVKEYITANRACSRNEELETYGHSLSFNRIWKSKKQYSRKQKHKTKFDE